MSQENKTRSIILNNILFLAQKSKSPQQNKRNVLNKWFQDAIKSYILEMIASPLIADPLKLHSSVEVKNFIREKINKNKVKYMAVIEQYFFYINKFNKKDIFIDKLLQIIKNPADITQYREDLSYNTQKVVRKQFVCFLILRYFEIYQQQEIPSFYELWNICFPQQTQTKKKLTKYDKKVQQKVTKRKYIKKSTYKNTSPITSNVLNEQTFHSYPLNFQTHNNLDQPLTNLSKRENNNSQSDLNYVQHEINNRIFEEESYEKDCMSCFLQFNNNQTL